MLDRKNIIIDMSAAVGDAPTFNNPPSGFYAKVQYLANLATLKFTDYLRLTASKNQFNRVTVYHYLGVAVTNSTEPVRGNDYIHPVVAPTVDYSTSVATKCLMTDGRLNFEFVPFNEDDSQAAKQATGIVSYFMNDQNNSFETLQSWIQDANLNKNGEVLVLPMRKETMFYREIVGTNDELKAFEIKAAEQGLETKRLSKKKIDVDVGAAMQAIMQGQEQGQQGQLNPQEPEANEPEDNQQEEANPNDEVLDQLAAHTIYKCKYKLTGMDFKIQYRHIEQHYFVCNPTISKLQDQDFCGFYDIMSIHDAGRLYPFIDLDELQKHAKYGPNGSYQAGALENSLAIHVRDSTPVQGQSTVASGTTDPKSRQITMQTCWIRWDWDDDGKDELIEICFSGAYITYIKEVEYIPLANMCPKPLTGNFYGYGIGERVVPQHEYMTAMARAEMDFAFQASTPMKGVNPEFVDADEMQNGKASLFILDSKFDPVKHIWEPQPLQGNLAYVGQSMERMNADRMSMIGMTQSADVLNPEVMSPGNSAAKLSLAMGPNQLIQDNYVRNCAIGVKELIYLTWRTCVQYADDYGIRKIVEKVTPKGEWLEDGKEGEKIAVFFDAQSMKNFEVVDRQQVEIDLALGLASEENRVLKQQIITQNQQAFTQAVQQLVQMSAMTPDIFKKTRKPYEDTLYALGVRDCEAYLVTLEEATKAMEQASQAAQQAKENPSADDQLKMAKAQESEAKAQKTVAEIQGTDFGSKIQAIDLLRGDSKSVNIQ